MEKPVPMPSPDLTSLPEACREYIDFLFSDEYNSDRANKYEHVILESAMEMVYGDNIYEIINARIDEVDEQEQRGI